MVPMLLLGLVRDRQRSLALPHDDRTAGRHHSFGVALFFIVVRSRASLSLEAVRAVHGGIVGDEAP